MIGTIATVAEVFTSDHLARQQLTLHLRNIVRGQAQAARERCETEG